MSNVRTNRQSGAVSLFVVIFAMLLLTVVTVSFLRLMMSDLRQASDTDLSRSAYDSAQAGVEDAKRALLRYQSYCLTASASDCDTLATSLSSDTCNEAVRIGGVVPGVSGEVQVQTTAASSTAASFDQAYTCVTMQLNTADVTGTLTENTSTYIPLKAVTDFDEVTISWFLTSDLSDPTASVQVVNEQTPARLMPEAGGSANWPQDRPPVIRAQIMQAGSSFTLEQFDYVSGSESNTNTLFLYPTRNARTADAFVGRDIRANDPSDSPDADTPGASPLASNCVTNITGGGYACSITLTLPEPIGGGERQGYLRLTPFYRGAEFKVELSGPTGPVDFKAVQPLIDSTGRANDLYRRVQSRVQLDDTGVGLPEAAVDVTTEFCKDFSVTNSRMTPGVCSY